MAGLNTNPAEEGLLRCHQAMEGMAEGVNEAAKCLVRGRELEKTDPQQAFEVYQKASQLFCQAEVENPAESEVRRMKEMQSQELGSVSLVTIADNSTKLYSTNAHSQKVF